MSDNKDIEPIDYTLEKMPSGPFVGQVYYLTHDVIKIFKAIVDNDQFIAAETLIRDFIWEKCKIAFETKNDSTRNRAFIEGFQTCMNRNSSAHYPGKLTAEDKNIIRLVIAGRNVAFEDNPDRKLLSALDKALEPYSALVPWDDQPDDFDPADVVLENYESMTREELIECCKAHDAHHQEHHDKEPSQDDLISVRDALYDVIKVADRKTVEFDKAREAIIILDSLLGAPVQDEGV